MTFVANSATSNPVVVNGSLQFVGSGSSSNGRISISSAVAGNALVIGTGGSVSSNGSLSISTQGGISALGAITSAGALTLQTTADNGGIAFNGGAYGADLVLRFPRRGPVSLVLLRRGA